MTRRGRARRSMTTTTTTLRLLHASSRGLQPRGPDLPTTHGSCPSSSCQTRRPCPCPCPCACGPPREKASAREGSKRCRRARPRQSRMRPSSLLLLLRLTPSPPVRRRLSRPKCPRASTTKEPSFRSGPQCGACSLCRRARSPRPQPTRACAGAWAGREALRRPTRSRPGSGGSSAEGGCWTRTPRGQGEAGPAGRVRSPRWRMPMPM